MPTSRKMTRLIARSSLGSPAARSLRARTPPQVTSRIIATCTAKARGTTSSRGVTKNTPYKPS